jgi:hypothetical protein
VEAPPASSAMSVHSDTWLGVLCNAVVDATHSRCHTVLATVVTVGDHAVVLGDADSPLGSDV